MNYSTKYMVHSNSTSKLTNVWAFHRSQKNFDKLPLMTQKKISEKNKSWLKYFRVSYALGLISEVEYRKAIHYVIYKGKHNKSITWKEVIGEC